MEGPHAVQSEIQSRNDTEVAATTADCPEQVLVPARPTSSTSPSAVTICAPIVPWLIASLLYGSGARVQECLQLRVKVIELTRGEIVIRDGKGSYSTWIGKQVDLA